MVIKVTFLSPIHDHDTVVVIVVMGGGGVGGVVITFVGGSIVHVRVKNAFVEVDCTVESEVA